MGLGQVLSEKMVYGRTGHLQNANLLEYKIPSVHEMPHVVPIIIESCDPEGPFGAKEAGEGPLLPILPAVVNAVYDAVGVRFRDLPLTPDIVYKGIERQRKALKLDDCLELPSPRLEHGPMQEVLGRPQLNIRPETRQDKELKIHLIMSMVYCLGLIPIYLLKTKLMVGEWRQNQTLNNLPNLDLLVRLG